MRPIDADAMRQDWLENVQNEYVYDTNAVLDSIDAQPTIEAEPVRHGRWVMTLYATTSKRNRVIANKKFACSECGYGNGRKQSNYCPNCGAKMRGDVK